MEPRLDESSKAGSRPRTSRLSDPGRASRVLQVVRLRHVHVVDFDPDSWSVVHFGVSGALLAGRLTDMTEHQVLASKAKCLNRSAAAAKSAAVPTRLEAFAAMA